MKFPVDAVTTVKEPVFALTNVEFIVYPEIFVPVMELNVAEFPVILPIKPPWIEDAPILLPVKVVIYPVPDVMKYPV